MNSCIETAVACMLDENIRSDDFLLPPFEPGIVG